MNAQEEESKKEFQSKEFPGQKFSEKNWRFWGPFFWGVDFITGLKGLQIQNPFESPKITRKKLLGVDLDEKGCLEDGLPVS